MKQAAKSVKPARPPAAGGAPGGAAALLDIHANIASPYDAVLSHQRASKRRLEARAQRFELLDQARELLPAFRVAVCCRAPAAAQVDVSYNHERTSARYGNLQTCSSVHVCPVCGAVIASERKAEIERAVMTWQQRGGVVTMATFTLRHHDGESLAGVAGVLGDAYRGLKAGKGWITFATSVDLVGSIAATEYTHGAHGWHPHKHVLIFSERGLNVGERERLKSRWLSAVKRAGGDAVRRACDVREVDASGGAAGVGSYLAKLSDWSAAHELAYSARKRARATGGATPMSLLAASRHDASAAALFVEYANWTFGKNHIVWSRGLRERLGLAPEQSDSEVLTAEEQAAELVTRLERGVWYAILRARGRALVLAAVEEERGGLARLNEYLAGLGMPPAVPYRGAPPARVDSEGAGAGDGARRAPFVAHGAVQHVYWLASPPVGRRTRRRWGRRPAGVGWRERQLVLPLAA